MASSSTCSPTSHQWNYDVFISFRGADVRDGFLSHLFRALCQNQIVTFKDENLDRGEEISPAILRVIEESSVSLVIFSQNFANSPWCLDELVKIVDCKKTMGHTVVPIFYHVDPTDVQELTGSFGEAFKGLHGEEFKSKIESWSNALRKTAEISGFDSRNVKVSDGYSEVRVLNFSFDFSIAGGELPERMKYKNENGSNIFLPMGQHKPLDFIVVAFSAVVASTDYEL